MTMLIMMINMFMMMIMIMILKIMFSLVCGLKCCVCCLANKHGFKVVTLLHFNKKPCSARLLNNKWYTVMRQRPYN